MSEVTQNDVVESTEFIVEDRIISKNKNLRPYKQELIIEDGQVDTLYYYKANGNK